MSRRSIRKRYQEGLTFKEIGEELGLSMEAVRQWERKGLGELRKPSRSRILEEFLEDSTSTTVRYMGTGFLPLIVPGQVQRREWR